ncbi:unnamed protein product [Heligmosomoides polygyrus]|uniref:CNH domain-containing protein n=1 Tax=Heligmosomoides polygyrus TaxID=6339 RepID=A0A183GNK5_HELPZ|nr:unnamed protein product [Heligmosomoides polygyrus]
MYDSGGDVRSSTWCHWKLFASRAKLITDIRVQATGPSDEPAYGDSMSHHMVDDVKQDPRSYAECGYVDGPLVRVGRSTGAKTNRLMCGTGDDVVLLITSGVGVIVSDRFRDAIISVECFNDRLMKVVVAAEQRMYYFFSAYAPQAGCSERAKDEFWTVLDEKTAEVPSEDAVLIEARNADGERILENADSHNLIIANAVFRKRDSHLVSFYGGSTKTQIDFIRVKHRDRKLLTDAKVVPYETVATQHRPLICTIKFALRG